MASTFDQWVSKRLGKENDFDGQYGLSVSICSTSMQTNCLVYQVQNCFPTRTLKNCIQIFMEQS